MIYKVFKLVDILNNKKYKNVFVEIVESGYYRINLYSKSTEYYEEILWLLSNKYLNFEISNHTMESNFNNEYVSYTLKYPFEFPNIYKQCYIYKYLEITNVLKVSTIQNITNHNESYIQCIFLNDLTMLRYKVTYCYTSYGNQFDKKYTIFLHNLN